MTNILPRRALGCTVLARVPPSKGRRKQQANTPDAYRQPRQARARPSARDARKLLAQGPPPLCARPSSPDGCAPGALPPPNGEGPPSRGAGAGCLWFGSQEDVPYGGRYWSRPGEPLPMQVSQISRTDIATGAQQLRHAPRRTVTPPKRGETKQLATSGPKPGNVPPTWHNEADSAMPLPRLLGSGVFPMRNFILAQQGTPPCTIRRRGGNFRLR